MNSNGRANDRKASRRSSIAYWVIAAIAAYFLLVEHREHVFAFLPFVLLLLCPLMHLFHHGHGGHGHGHDEAIAPDTESRKTANPPPRTSDHQPH